MKECVALETVRNICYILVMQLNDFPYKNLKSRKDQWVIEATRKLNARNNILSRHQPVLANQPCPSSLAVTQWIILNKLKMERNQRTQRTKHK